MVVTAIRRPHSARRSPGLAELGELGAALMRTHYAFDPLRFLEPGGGDDSGYARFLASQLEEDGSSCWSPNASARSSATSTRRSSRCRGRSCATNADSSTTCWSRTRRAGSGIGEALLDAAIEWLREQGMPRVVLGTAAQNDTARRLFERRGFRPTMIEMTLEL